MVYVGERYNRYGTRILLEDNGEVVISVPRQWTDLVAPDPEIIIGRRRSYFLLADLIKLESLVVQLKACSRQKRGKKRKVKYAANVKKNTPHMSDK